MGGILPLNRATTGATRLVVEETTTSKVINITIKAFVLLELTRRIGDQGLVHRFTFF